MTTPFSLAAPYAKPARAELVEAPFFFFGPKSMIAPIEVQPFDKIRVDGKGELE